MMKTAKCDSEALAPCGVHEHHATHALANMNHAHFTDTCVLEAVSHCTVTVLQDETKKNVRRTTLANYWHAFYWYDLQSYRTSAGIPNGARYGITRQLCDEAFLGDMKSSCAVRRRRSTVSARALRKRRSVCTWFADQYFRAVRNFGALNFYEIHQIEPYCSETWVRTCLPDPSQPPAGSRGKPSQPRQPAAQGRGQSQPRQSSLGETLLKAATSALSSLLPASLTGSTASSSSQTPPSSSSRPTSVHAGGLSRATPTRPSSVSTFRSALRISSSGRQPAMPQGQLLASSQQTSLSSGGPGTVSLGQTRATLPRGSTQPGASPASSNPVSPNRSGTAPGSRPIQTSPFWPRTVVSAGRPSVASRTITGVGSNARTVTSGTSHTRTVLSAGRSHELLTRPGQASTVQSGVVSHVIRTSAAVPG
ncbi:hypothetical protein BaRGS_00038416 [Batillaria attramentaria]|uniref:Uncharacterized protein n=1 Tax=Batillaria attramentaria TaxID=370345 RepID=A0ABD0J5S6_9CAEN